MPEVFDLTNLKQLIEREHPACVVIVDTNIVMDEPDFRKWRTGLGPTVFVLSDTILLELEHISKRDQRKNIDQQLSIDKARATIKSVTHLFEQGEITDGIKIDDLGWFIGVSTYNRESLNSALAELAEIVEAFHSSDTKLIILTRECSEIIDQCPVVMATKENNLFNLIKLKGIPCHLFASFPLEIKIPLKPVDWDQTLADVQSTIKEKSIQVEVTLTAYKSPDPWLMAKTRPFVIAEGYGVIHYVNHDLNFLWTIPFCPDSPFLTSQQSEKTDIPPLHINLLGCEDSISQDLFDALGDKLLQCRIAFRDEEDGPTVQPPEVILEIMILFEYAGENGVSESITEDLRRKIDESGGIANYWADRILNKGHDHQVALLKLVIQYLRNCWQIGQRYRFTLVPSGKEMPESNS